MSNAVFPELSGLAIEGSCNSEFVTVVHTPVNGAEVRAAYAGYPMWIFSLNYELLDDLEYDDLRVLHGFKLQQRGRFDSFLFSYKNANAVTEQTIGTGNGVKTTFQLRRDWGGFIEPIENPNQIDAILLDGETVDTGDFSVSSTGLVTFDTAPANGVVVQASFSYFYRCRFETDLTDFKEFSPQLFSHEDFAFRGSVVNKV